MANWLDKFNKIADKAIATVEDAASKTVKTYQDKGFDGLREKTTDIISKTGEGITKTANKITEQSQSYLKTLNDSNKDVIQEVQSNLGKDTISSKIASGLAATANTTQTVAGDLATVTKKLYQNLVTEIKSSDLISTEKTTNEETFNTSSLKDELDLVSLDVVLKDILKAQKLSGNIWIAGPGITYKVYDRSWFNPESNYGEKNAVSLLNFHLAKVAKLDYNDPTVKKELIIESLILLEQSFPDIVLKHKTTTKDAVKNISDNIEEVKNKAEKGTTNKTINKASKKIGVASKTTSKTIGSKTIGTKAEVEKVVKKTVTNPKVNSVKVVNKVGKVNNDISIKPVKEVKRGKTATLSENKAINAANSNKVAKNTAKKASSMLQSEVEKVVTKKKAKP